ASGWSIPCPPSLWLLPALFSSFSFILRPPPRSPLFPYTTLFRSLPAALEIVAAGPERGRTAAGARIDCARAAADGGQHCRDDECAAERHEHRSSPIEDKQGLVEQFRKQLVDTVHTGGRNISSKVTVAC